MGGCRSLVEIFLGFTSLLVDLVHPLPPIINSVEKKLYLRLRSNTKNVRNYHKMDNLSIDAYSITIYSIHIFPGLTCFKPKLNSPILNDTQANS